MPSATGCCVGRAQRARPAPRDLLQREAQRLGVGELAVEQRQRGLQRGELGVGERDRGQVEVLRAQRVVLLLGDAVGRLVDRQLDAERLELGAVGVEAARERVLVHAAVALDVAADLQRGDGTALGHQVRDQRELTDELLGVLRHGSADDRSRRATGAGRAPLFARLLCAMRGADARFRGVSRTASRYGIGSRRPVTRLVIIDDHEALREGLDAAARHGGHARSSARPATSPRASTSSTTPSRTSRSSTSGCPTAAASTSPASCSSATPELGVILYTGDSDVELLYDGLDSGARGYALKAGSIDELLAAVERVAGGRHVRRPAAGPRRCCPRAPRRGCPRSRRASARSCTSWRRA